MKEFGILECLGSRCTVKFQIFMAQYFREFRDSMSDHKNFSCNNQRIVKWRAWQHAIQCEQLAQDVRAHVKHVCVLLVNVGIELKCC